MAGGDVDRHLRSLLTRFCDQNATGRDFWLVDGTAAGTTRTERNLTYTVVFNASHMVAVDNPRAMLVLLNTFINASSSGAPAGGANGCPSSGGGLVAPEVPAPRVPKRLYVALVLIRNLSPLWQQVA